MAVRAARAPSVAAAIAVVWSGLALAGDASPERLRELVDAAIPDESMGRGWDLASRVATTGSGDCTEHAMLLTALARAAGLPARVALGVLLVQEQGRVHAFGHAWSEIHDGASGRWRPLDATPLPQQVDAVVHLPTALLADEVPATPWPWPATCSARGWSAWRSVSWPASLRSPPGRRTPGRGAWRSG